MWALRSLATAALASAAFLQRLQGERCVAYRGSYGILAVPSFCFSAPSTTCYGQACKQIAHLGHLTKQLWLSSARKPTKVFRGHGSARFLATLELQPWQHQHHCYHWPHQAQVDFFVSSLRPDTGTMTGWFCLAVCIWSSQRLWPCFKIYSVKRKLQGCDYMILVNCLCLLCEYEPHENIVYV